MAEKTDGRKVGSNPPPPPPVDDITPVNPGAVAPTQPDPRLAELEKQLAEVKAAADRNAAEAERAKAAAAKAQAEADAHAAEVARLKAAGANPSYAPGRRYLVRLEGNPDLVVECADGNPFEAYKQQLGIIRSDYAPVIAETELPVGRVA